MVLKRQVSEESSLRKSMALAPWTHFSQGMPSAAASEHCPLAPSLPVLQMPFSIGLLASRMGKVQAHTELGSHWHLWSLSLPRSSDQAGPVPLSTPERLGFHFLHQYQRSTKDKASSSDLPSQFTYSSLPLLSHIPPQFYSSLPFSWLSFEVYEGENKAQ